MWIAAVVLIIGGLVITGVGALARDGGLARQGLVGIRTRATMASNEAWRAAQAAGAVWVMAGGVIMAVGGVVTLLADSENAQAAVALVSVGAAAIPIVIGGLRGHAAARRLG